MNNAQWGGQTAAARVRGRCRDIAGASVCRAAVFTAAFALCGLVTTPADAAMVFVSQNRFVESGNLSQPTAFGVSQGAQPILTPTMTAAAPDFGAFNASGSSGVFQNSTLTPDLIRVLGFGAATSGPFAPPTNLYEHYRYTKSHFEVTFTLDSPHAFRHKNGLAGGNSFHLSGPNGRRINLFGTTEINGELAAGQWTLTADIGYGATASAHHADFSVTPVPEPAAGGLLMVAATATATRRGRRRDAVAVP